MDSSYIFLTDLTHENKCLRQSTNTCFCMHPSPQNQIYPAQCMECIAKARSIKEVYQLLNSLVGNLLSRFSLQVT